MTDFLEHYGVKGMKWGKRKSTKTKTTYKKAPKTLSDAELKKRIQRLENEKRYNTLNQQHVSSGRAAATEILAGSGKQIARTVATGVGTLLVKNLLEAKFGSEVAKAVK